MWWLSSNTKTPLEGVNAIKRPAGVTASRRIDVSSKPSVVISLQDSPESCERYTLPYCAANSAAVPDEATLATVPASIPLVTKCHVAPLSAERHTPREVAAIKAFPANTRSFTSDGRTGIAIFTGTEEASW